MYPPIYFNFKITRNFIKTSCRVYRNMLKWYRTRKVYVIQGYCVVQSGIVP